MAGIVLTEENFSQEVLTRDGLVVVEFWAPWCPHCRRITQAVSAAAEDAGVTLGQVNTDDAQQLAQKYRINTIPTLLCFRGGEAKGRVIAPDSKAAIDRFLKEQA